MKPAKEERYKNCPVECPILKLYHEADALADGWERKYYELIKKLREIKNGPRKVS